ncbi:phosphopantetheine-binding protein [Pseudomonas azerbaijanoccidentalis]
MSGAKGADAQIEREVIRVLSEYFPADRRRIEVGSRLVEDLYVDSMNVVEIVMMLNEVFSVELPQKGVAEWKAVSDICCLLRICKEGC